MLLVYGLADNFRRVEFQSDIGPAQHKWELEEREERHHQRRMRRAAEDLEGLAVSGNSLS